VTVIAMVFVLVWLLVRAARRAEQVANDQVVESIA
jgi:flagellar biogenesis protein FliO